MVNQQLLDYIKQQTQQGINNEQIKQSLIANGWQTSDVESAFNELQTPAQPKKRRFRKFIKVSLIVLGSLIGLVLLINFLPYIFGLITKDIAQPNVDDLKLANINIPQGDNAYYDLLEFGNFPISEATVKIYETGKLETLTNHINGKEWDEKFVEEIISKNTNAFAIFDRAAKKPKYQDLGTDSPEKIGPNTVLASLSPLRQIARVDAIRALYLFKQGKEQEGIDEAIKIIDFGQKIQDSQITLIQYLVSAAIKSVGLDALTTMIQETTLPSDRLISYINNLDRFKNNKNGLITAFKSEYANAEKSVDIVLADTQKSEESLLPGGNIPLNPMNKKGESFYFRPNETKQLFADWARAQILVANKPCGFIKDEGDKKLSTSIIKLYFTENAVGKVLSNIVAVSLNSSVYKKCNEEFQISADQLLLAIKAYKFDSGNYPASLDALLPHYITTIPIDPFGGEQIKYLVSKKILYSIGKDGIDSKGGEGNDWREMADPTFKINF